MLLERFLPDIFYPLASHGEGGGGGRFARSIYFGIQECQFV